MVTAGEITLANGEFYFGREKLDVNYTIFNLHVFKLHIGGRGDGHFYGHLLLATS